jgi:hypothetical protein
MVNVKNIKILFLNSIKEFIYIFYTNIININLYLIKKITKKKYIYSDEISFGATFAYYIENFSKIIQNNIKILVFSQLEMKIAEFFFKKKFIANLFILIPHFIPVYRINVLLKKKKYYEPNIFFKLDFPKIGLLPNKHKKLLIKLLKKNINYISPGLKKLHNKKFIIMFVKHYNNTNVVTYTSEIRQTVDFKKIYKTIEFFEKKNIKVIILGNNSDKSIPILRKKYLNNSNVQFFFDLSLNQSMTDQLYIHYYSLLSIGSDSGVFIMSMYLKKKIILFDSFIGETFKFYKKNKNIIVLLKKIKIKKKIRSLKEDDYLLKTKSKPIETSYNEIIKAYKSFY